MLTDELGWQRVMLTARAGAPQRAAGIAKRFARPSEQALAELLVRVWNHPAGTLQILRCGTTPRVRDIVS